MCINPLKNKQYDQLYCLIQERMTKSCRGKRKNMYVTANKIWSHHTPCKITPLQTLNGILAYTIESVVLSMELTIAHKSGRVWAPGPIWWYSIWCTHCCPIACWNKPCVTSEDYPGTTQCAWDSRNGATFRSSRHPTVNWKERLMKIKWSLMKSYRMIKERE